MWQQLINHAFLLFLSHCAMDVMEINNILILINSSNACELDALFNGENNEMCCVTTSSLARVTIMYPSISIALNV